MQKTNRRAQPSVGVGTGEISPGITFREFGQLWTSGELARQFPDHVKKKKTSKDDGSRLKNYIYPLIGDEPLRRFAGRQAVALVERVLEGLPPVGTTFSRASRRQVIQIIHRLMTLAVYPAKILTANPPPKGFLPKLGDEKAKAYLFPDEDAKLMCRVRPYRSESACSMVLPLTSGDGHSRMTIDGHRGGDSTSSGS